MSAVGSGAADRRGQLLLTAAFLIAVALVALTFVFNASLHTGTLADRATVEAGGEGALSFRADVTRDLEQLVRVANARGTDYGDRATRVDDGTTAIRDSLREEYAAQARVVDVEVAATNRGEQLEQASDGTFPSSIGVTGERVRDFEIDVGDRSALSGSAAGSFAVVVTDDAGEQWEISIYEDSGDTVVEVERVGTGILGSCRDGTGSRTHVDLSNATVAGDHCNALDFFERAEAPYDVDYDNGGNVEGRYHLVTDDGGSGDVVYGASVDVVYRSPDVQYEARIRIAPGELS